MNAFYNLEDYKLNEYDKTTIIWAGRIIGMSVLALWLTSCRSAETESNITGGTASVKLISREVHTKMILK